MLIKGINIAGCTIITKKNSHFLHILQRFAPYNFDLSYYHCLSLQERCLDMNYYPFLVGLILILNGWLTIAYWCVEFMNTAYIILSHIRKHYVNFSASDDH